MKIRLVIDGVALHGLPAGSADAFLDALSSGLDAELRQYAMTPGAGLPGSRQAPLERMAVPVRQGVPDGVASALGAGIAAQALRPTSGNTA